MNLISELFTNPYSFFIVVVALIVSITIHEFAHALVAYKLGDPTPKLQGRVTLNPLAHLDLLGSVLLLIVGFGWGKPVEYNIDNLNRPKRDSGLISFAGPFSNLILGTLLIFLGRLLQIEEFYTVAYINFFLAFFNLIPIYPLDGFSVVLSILPYDLAEMWRDTEKYSLIFILVLIFMQIPGMVITPITEFLMFSIDSFAKLLL